MVQKTLIASEETKTNNKEEGTSKFLYFNIDVPFWTSFKVGSSVNFHSTYSIPPLTTLYGLIANALGLEQDDYSLRDDISFCLKVIYGGEIIEDYVNIFKIGEQGGTLGAKNKKEILGRYDKAKASKEEYSELLKLFIEKRGWLSEVDAKKILDDAICKEKPIYDRFGQPDIIRTQVVRERIIKPKYRVYLKTKNIELLKKIEFVLENPARPLYLGQSDDVVIIEKVSKIIDETEIKKEYTDFVDSVVPFHAKGCEIMLLPTKFILRGKNKYEKEQLGFSYHPSGKIKLPEKEEHYLMDNDYVVFEDFKKS
ncbi:MAG: hypothetical protein BWK75_01240 [Candidatus Altiarchaeales archaeon A3]|nr:MAG: hypothetical protein BWK75_01240 [Candidatus Altiarchaeales archaeon A3]